MEINERIYRTYCILSKISFDTIRKFRREEVIEKLGRICIKVKYIYKLMDIDVQIFYPMDSSYDYKSLNSNNV